MRQIRKVVIFIIFTLWLKCRGQKRSMEEEGEEREVSVANSLVGKQKSQGLEGMMGCRKLE